MMVLMVQVVEYFSATYLLAPLGWPTIMSLQNNDSVFTIMEIFALSLIIFAPSLSFRSLIFNFIDNVKPQPDPKGEISKFEFKVHSIVDGITGFVISHKLQLLFSGDTKVHWPKLRWRLEVSDLYIIKSYIWSVTWSPIFLTLRVFHWQPIKKCSIVIIVIVLNIFHEII